MILITHQLHEAVFLADRVAVLSRRPGELVHLAEIDLPKPRTRDVAYSAEFIAHVDALRRMIDH
jgi:NitT/TauT family transport system ATP-binding protein